MSNPTPAATDLQSALNAMQATLDEARIYVGTEIDGGTVVISGEVESVENRQAVLDVAAATIGRLGVPVVDAMDLIDFVSHDEVDGGGDVFDAESWQEAAPGAAIDSVDGPPQLDPDFAGDIGTTNVMEAVEEGIPYFPPTDPVVRSVNSNEELAVLNGFSASSMSGDDDEVEAGAAPVWNDDDLEALVRRELSEDASTTDLGGSIRIKARNGVVHLHGEAPTLDDAENAEAVAARIPGVVEVREELHITGLERNGSSR